MFITVEGIDGSGKSTQSSRLAEWLEAVTCRHTVRTFEPGGWSGGLTLREFILNSRGYSAMSELLLFLADRSEHVKRVILPSLRDGHNVICERYNASTLAYQSGGHEMDTFQVRSIIAACNFPVPDAEILLDISPEIAYERLVSRGGKPDKFEEEGLQFMRTVSARYALIAADSPERFIRVNCDGRTEDEVFAAITAGIEARLWQSR